MGGVFEALVEIMLCVAHLATYKSGKFRISQGTFGSPFTKSWGICLDQGSDGASSLLYSILVLLLEVLAFWLIMSFFAAIIVLCCSCKATFLFIYQHAG